MVRPTHAEIDLSAIAANVALACRLAGPETRVMAVVKADAYGHGAVPVARVALGAGATWLGVAIPEEAVPLREAGIACGILVLGPIAPDQADLVAAHDLDQCVSDQAQAEALDRAARARGRVLALHLKVDTGMGRVGLRPREVRRVAEKIWALPSVRLAGLMTHFADAEADEPGFAREQLVRFAEAARELAAAGIPAPLRHAANSAALLFLPEARLDLVRPGIMLYGYHPRGPRGGPESPLRPALRLRTAISQIQDVAQGESVSYGRTFVAPRDLRVATLPVGYADGCGRLLSNRGRVLIRGQRVPIVGRVCMDMTMVDVSGFPDVRVGDEAVLIGRQGADEITADEVAELQGTISYEVLCRIGPRVPRIYLPPPPAASATAS
ncbi:MAG: alanine racemase [candidate division NC10 bacterium RIFCSPLOWO2_02_FULL_66_22]|nr:MAG: alanine racemase [candidate division NC10 bacterium RIFCSPLOWO2_02_FULL_66_22]